MRRLICLGIVAAAVLAIPMAQSATAPTVTLNVVEVPGPVRRSDPPRGHGLEPEGRRHGRRLRARVHGFRLHAGRDGDDRHGRRLVVRREARDRDHLPGAHGRQREPHAARRRAPGDHDDAARQRTAPASRSPPRARSRAGRSRCSSSTRASWSTLAQLHLERASRRRSCRARSCRCSRRRCARR